MPKQPCGVNADAGAGGGRQGVATDELTLIMPEGGGGWISYLMRKGACHGWGFEQVASGLLWCDVQGKHDLLSGNAVGRSALVGKWARRER